MDLSQKRKFDLVIGLVLITALKPFTLLLGIFLKRDHELVIKKQLVVLKILGGGSLIMSYHALYSLKLRYPDKKLTLICSPGVKPFAELMGIFDEILVIRMNSLASFLFSCITAIKNCFRVDGILDLEIHSKLTTIFCLFTCARNRIGLYQGWNNWQRGLTTHLFFYNNNAPIFLCYNQVANALGASIVPISEVKDYFLKINNFDKIDFKKRHDSEVNIGISAFCSDLGQEREFSNEEWIKIFKIRIDLSIKTTIHILGGPADIEKAILLKEKINSELPEINVVDVTGKMPLHRSVEYISSLDTLFTIDSGLNHLARYTNIDIVSYWGPTDPHTRLNVIPGLNEEIIYNKLFCSPCVHIVHDAPCAGQNICMKQYVGLETDTVNRVGWS